MAEEEGLLKAGRYGDMDDAIKLLSRGEDVNQVVLGIVRSAASH